MNCENNGNNGRKDWKQFVTNVRGCKCAGALGKPSRRYRVAGCGLRGESRADGCGLREWKPSRRYRVAGWGLRE